MHPDQIAEVRGQIAELGGRLDEFVEGVFASLPRKDLRDKGGSNLQGLMREGRRKSMQPMGGRLGVDYQQLAQFVSSSPRPAEPAAGGARGRRSPCASGVGAPGVGVPGVSAPGVSAEGDHVDRAGGVGD